MPAFDYVAFDIAFDVDTSTCSFDSVAFDGVAFDVCSVTPVVTPAAGWFQMWTPAPVYDEEEEEILVAMWREMNNYYG
jgi:hypothetical protein